MTLLQQGISEPVFYGDLIYKFNSIFEKPNFSDQLKKISKRYKMDIACILCDSLHVVAKFEVFFSSDYL